MEVNGFESEEDAVKALKRPDGYLREIVIDRPLFGEDAVGVIKAAKWALAKAFSRPLRGWGSSPIIIRTHASSVD